MLAHREEGADTNRVDGDGGWQAEEALVLLAFNIPLQDDMCRSVER